MLKVGVTGGIGSGKSVVCRVFATLGIPVFDADKTAAWLTDNDAEVVASVKALFGENIYRNNKLDREAVGAIVFNDPAKLKQLNAIVHPATIEAGRRWMSTQTAPYAIKEAAIFFETGSNKEMDVMIGVTAPESTRIKRVLSRPGMTREKIMQRISSQMNDREKMALCDYVIHNEDDVPIIPQVMNIHRKLLERA